MNEANGQTAEVISALRTAANPDQVAALVVAMYAARDGVTQAPRFPVPGAWEATDGGAVDGAVAVDGEPTSAARRGPARVQERGAGPRRAETLRAA